MAYTVLFVDSTNSGRSIIAEALLNALGGGRFRAASEAPGPVHPLALEALEKAGYETCGLHSKSWQAFANRGAPAIDFVITIDDARDRICPAFPGRPVVAHWHLPHGSGEGTAEHEFHNAYTHVHPSELLKSA